MYSKIPYLLPKIVYKKPHEHKKRGFGEIHAKVVDLWVFYSFYFSVFQFFYHKDATLYKGYELISSLVLK